MGALPTPSASASFVSRVREALGALPPTERRLGEFVLDFPGNLSSYSASELARLTGVSNASVTRFVRRLGYESYDEARRHAREAGSSGAPLYLAKGVAVHLSARDRRMCVEFRGDYRVLAKKYGLTEMRVRQIVDAWQREKYLARQRGLPGLD